MPYEKKIRKDLAENVVSYAEDESDDRAAASKIKVTKKMSQNLFSTSLFIWILESFYFTYSINVFLIKQYDL